MVHLNTSHLYLPTITPPPLPVQSITFPQPLSYEFRVVEHVGEDDKVVKVGLQYQVWQHDQYGVGTVIQSWNDVERVKMKEGTIVI